MSMESQSNYSDYGKGTQILQKEWKCDDKQRGTENPTGGTKQSHQRTGYAMSIDYSKYLQGKYSYMNSGTTFMAGRSEQRIRIRALS